MKKRVRGICCDCLGAESYPAAIGRLGSASAAKFRFPNDLERLDIRQTERPYPRPPHLAVRHRDDDLALGVACFEPGNRFRDALEGVHAVNYHPERTRVNEGEFLPNGAAQKTSLNRSILDAAPSMLVGMCRTKAVEAASEFVKANTRKLKPTQRCHCCGKIVKKDLSQRQHVCQCGANCGRDENAAKTILRWMLEGDFWLGIQPG